MSYPTILEVVPGSPAAGAGLRPGDELLAVEHVPGVDAAGGDLQGRALVAHPGGDLALGAVGGVDRPQDRR